MGTCHTASIFYGFLINDPSRLLALLDALCKRDPNIEGPARVEDMQELDYEDQDWLESIIDSWLGKEDYPFRIRKTYEEDEERCEFAFYLEGCIQETETWGRDIGISKLKVLEEPWNNAELMKEAKDAFKRIEESEIFKEAGIIVKPTWLLGLVIG